MTRGVELVRLARCARCSTASNSSPSGSAPFGRGSRDEPQPDARAAPGADVAAGDGPPPSCRAPASSPHRGARRPRARGTRPSRTAPGSARSEQALGVGLVLGEEELPASPLAVEAARRACVGASTTPRSGRPRGRCSRGRRGRRRPRTSVLRNQSGGQHVERRLVGPAVGRGDLDEDVLGRGFGVLDEHVEVAVVRRRRPCRAARTRAGPAPRRRFSSTSSRVRKRAPAGTCRAHFMYECVGVLSR